MSNRFYTSPADHTYPSTLSQGALMRRQCDPEGWKDTHDRWPADQLERDIAMLECEIYRERNRVKALKSQPNYDHKEALTRLTWIKNMTKALNKKQRERSGK